MVFFGIKSKELVVMKKLAIFASGSGTNAQKIIEYFLLDRSAEVAIVLSNKKNAMALNRAKQFNIPAITFSRTTFYETVEILKVLKNHNIDLIVLAGFLWLVPDYLLKKYPNKIINIHPALLPKYGGKGMYGMRVHQSVINSGDPESGITIHNVNEKYDEGAIIFQAKCRINDGDSPEMLAQKIHKLEHEHFPRVIKKLLEKL